MPVIILNIILPLLICAVLFAAYKVKGMKRKIATLVCVPILIILYGMIQPSYMPKGTVTRIDTPTYEHVEREVVDNMRKVVPGDVRDARMKAERQEIHRRLKETE